MMLRPLRRPLLIQHKPMQNLKLTERLRLMQMQKPREKSKPKPKQKSKLKAKQKLKCSWHRFDHIVYYQGSSYPRKCAKYTA